MNSSRWKLLIVLAIAAVAAFPMYWFPDFDIRLMGIRAHRNFLFHSAALTLVLFLLVRKRNLQRVLWKLAAALVMGVGIGIGVHLFADVFQSAHVLFPFVGSLVDGTSLDDRLWVGVNSLASFSMSFALYRRIRPGLREKEGV